MTGKSIFDQVHPEDQAAVVSAYLDGAASGSHVVVQCRYRCRDGRYIWIDCVGNPYRGADGNFTGGTINSREITDRKKLESFQRSLVENSLQGLFIFHDNRIVFANNAISAITGYSRQELLAITLDELIAIIHPDDREGLAEKIQNRLEGNLVNPRDEFRVISKNGGVRYISSYTTRAEYEDGGALHVSMIDVTDKMIAERKMLEAMEIARLITGNITETLWMMDMNLVTTFITPSVEHTRGFALEELRSMKLEDHLAPGSLEHATGIMAELLTPENLADPSKKISVRMELEFYRKDGSTFWSENVLSLLRDAAGKPIGILGVGRDISDRKAVEDRLKSALAEKDYLLREIHHRVKNNMMVIYSLLGLQSDYITDPKAREALKESQTKISSMIKLYDQLNRSARASHPDVGSYIRALTGELFSAYNSGDGRVRLETEIEDVPLDVKRSFYAGLIINELVGNSLKHAFGHAGENAVFLVSVTLKQEGSRIRLVVADNGAGMPEERHEGARSGFGLNMVTMLVSQMAGTIEISRNGGTGFSILFPLKGGDTDI